MLILTLGASNVAAQPSPDFPPSVTTFINGERHEAFNLGGFTRLLHIDAEVVHLRRANAILDANVRALENANIALHGALDTTQRDYEVLQAERNRLQQRWADENRRRLEAENVPNIGGIVGWVFAVVFAVTSLSLGILYGASR